MSGDGNQPATFGNQRLRRLVIGTMCLALGFTLLLSIGRNATIVRIPVKLQAGETIQTNFTAKTSRPLWIEFRLNRHQGVPDATIDEAIHPSKMNVDVDWSVRQGAMVTAGNSASARGGEFSPDSRSLFIGLFKPDHAGNYEFWAKINMKREVSGLAAANPCLVIRPALTGSYVNIVWLKILSGGTLALVGLIDLFRAIRSRQPLQPSSVSGKPVLPQ